ncbi:MAG: hypothetical protein ACLP01_28730 [Solirubrobacteraceae bacterium]
MLSALRDGSAMTAGEIAAAAGLGRATLSTTLSGSRRPARSPRPPATPAPLSPHPAMRGCNAEANDTPRRPAPETVAWRCGSWSSSTSNPNCPRPSGIARAPPQGVTRRG